MHKTACELVCRHDAVSVMHVTWGRVCIASERLPLICTSLKTRTKGSFRTAFTMPWPERWYWRIKHHYTP